MSGLVWATGDVITAARSNQKGNVVGSGTSISNISTTYVGMVAVCDSTSSGYNIDSVQFRNASNTGWNIIYPQAIHVPVETVNLTYTLDQADSVVANMLYASRTTFNSGTDYVLPTQITINNQDSITGNITVGFYVDTASYPTNLINQRTISLSSGGSATVRLGSGSVASTSSAAIWIALLSNTAFNSRRFLGTGLVIQGSYSYTATLPSTFPASLSASFNGPRFVNGVIQRTMLCNIPIIT